MWDEASEPRSLKFQNAFLFSTTPRWSNDVLRRRDRFVRILGAQLSVLFPKSKARLPPELCNTILDNELLHYISTCTDHDIWQRRNSCSAQLDLSHGIWAHYTFIDGVRYIERLTRAPPSMAEEEVFESSTNPDLRWKRLLRPGGALQTACAFVLEDHLGVRQLVFSETTDYDTISHRLPDATSLDAYWRTLHLHTQVQLKLVSDGIKIRGIDTVAPCCRGSECHNWQALQTAWRLPTPRLYPRVCRYNTQYSPRSHKIFTSVYLETTVVNVPGITAYSALWDRGRLMAFRVHGLGDTLGSYANNESTIYSDYERLCPTGVWVHFCLGENERLSSIFTHQETPHMSPGLLLRTSKGRGMEVAYANAFHTYPTGDVGRKLASKWYHSYSLLPDTSARIHHSVAGSHHHLRSEDAYVCLVVEQHGQSLPLNDPSTDDSLHGEHTFEMPGHRHHDLPTQLQNFNYVASSVSLDSVVSVTASYKSHGVDGRLAVCGMLFRYKSDMQCPPAVLGEFRLDRTGKPIDLSTANVVCLGYIADESSATNMRLRHIVAGRPISDDNITWTRVSLKGEIDGWYTYEKLLIFLQDGRMTPESYWDTFNQSSQGVEESDDDFAQHDQDGDDLVDNESEEFELDQDVAEAMESWEDSI